MVGTAATTVATTIIRSDTTTTNNNSTTTTTTEKRRRSIVICRGYRSNWFWWFVGLLILVRIMYTYYSIILNYQSLLLYSSSASFDQNVSNNSQINNDNDNGDVNTLRMKQQYCQYKEYPIIHNDNYFSNNQEDTTTTTSTSRATFSSYTTRRKIRIKVYVRVLLFEHIKRPNMIRFRQQQQQQQPTIVHNDNNLTSSSSSPTNNTIIPYISDEVYNICMDGWNRSSSNRYHHQFHILDPIIVPDYHIQPNYTIYETEYYNDWMQLLQEQQKEKENATTTRIILVWVADMRHLVLQSDYSIYNQMVYNVNRTREYWKQQQQQLLATTTTTASSVSLSLPKLQVVFMDFRDYIREKKLCRKLAIQTLIDMLGKYNVRLVMQQVVRKRHWDKERNFVHPGYLYDSTNDVEQCFHSPILQIPYTVRSDYADTILDHYEQYLPSILSSSSFNNNNNNNKVQKIKDYSNTRLLLPSDTIRNIDVTHFWSVEHTANAQLRSAVSYLLLSMQQNETIPVDDNDDNNNSNNYNKRRRNITVFAEYITSSTSTNETKSGTRTAISQSYLQTLMGSKIIIVAQRDGWEDHYRLFEAIIGGALVMTDPMITMPENLIHKKSIIIYNSIHHLREMILYYLDPKNKEERIQIARKGWEVAMTQHRSYHWMERIFFGDILSKESLI